MKPIQRAEIQRSLFTYIIEAPLGGSTAAQSFWSREGCDKEGSLEEESLEI